MMYMCTGLPTHVQIVKTTLRFFQKFVSNQKTKPSNSQIWKVVIDVSSVFIIYPFWQCSVLFSLQGLDAGVQTPEQEKYSGNPVFSRTLPCSNLDIR